QIAKLDKIEISLKIKSRRDQLVEYAEAFHSLIQEKGKLAKPLKGSEDAEIDNTMIPCFECIKKDP
ncbi:MAG: hypothetical protein R3250_17095, partial [Melioribacteraceae bacterium]|nr:hypothetical protein [Melioribacteraceae bacterium]